MVYPLYVFLGKQPLYLQPSDGKFRRDPFIQFRFTNLLYRLRDTLWGPAVWSGLVGVSLLNAYIISGTFQGIEQFGKAYESCCVFKGKKLCFTCV